MKEDERRCTKCRKVAHWRQFARIESYGSPKQECLDCFKDRMNPPDKPKQKATVEDLLALIPNLDEAV